jgi:hypothetical protein
MCLTKKCIKCGSNKALSEFYIKSKLSDDTYTMCKICYNEKKREYASKDSVKTKEVNDRKSKKYRDKNKDKLNAQSREYHKKNSTEINKRRVKNAKEQYHSDPLYKLSVNMRNLIRKSVTSCYGKKAKKTNEILDCTFEEFKIHIEKQFTSEMSWENYGSYWEYDHIVPLSSAKTDSNVIALNHYTNFQPLEVYINRHVKSDRLDWQRL